MDVILTEIKTRKYRVDEVVHNEKEGMKFMAVVFVGAVEYVEQRRVVSRARN